MMLVETRWRCESAPGPPVPAVASDAMSSSRCWNWRRPPPQCTARGACGGRAQRGREVLETYDAPRRLNALLPGKRPGVPLEPVAEGAAVTGGSSWLPGLLSWWCRRCTAKTSVDKAPPSTSLLWLKKEEVGEGEEAGVGGEGEGGEAREGDTGDQPQDSRWLAVHAGWIGGLAAVAGRGSLLLTASSHCLTSSFCVWVCRLS